MKCDGIAFPSGAPEFTHGFSGVRVIRSLVLMCMFCRSLCVLLYFFFWPLCCLFFFDIRIIITPLVSSNSSYKYIFCISTTFVNTRCKSWYLIQMQLLFNTLFSLANVYREIHNWHALSQGSSENEPPYWILEIQHVN